MKNIILCAYGTGIGGMEVFFSGLVRYLLNNQYRVCFITLDTATNIYKTLLKDEWTQLEIIYRLPDNIMYMSEDERCKQRQLVLSQMKSINIDNSYGVCGFYRDLLILIDIFKLSDLKITYIWPHPLDWVNYIPLKQTTYYFKKRECHPHYKFQKKLFKELDDFNASYYTSYAIYNFNCWYYNEFIKLRHIEGLPVQDNAGIISSYNAKQNIDTLNVLWVGRFDYYKVDAIEYIYHTLERLAKCYPALSINFNIAGHGAAKYHKRLRKIISPNSIAVNFLGTIPPTSLNDVFINNDVGIAMGVTVKQMGKAGLPSILIDSMSDRYKGGNCCNWLFDVETGDDGDGIYYYYSNRPLSYRKTLHELLSQVIEHPDLLESYSQKCSDYVNTTYEHDRQYAKVVDRIINSKFYSTNREIYTYSFFRRIIKRIFHIIYH